MALDPAFHPRITTMSNTMLTAVARQPEGRLLVAGSFEFYQGYARRSLVRLEPDGTLDASFNTRQGIRGRVYTVETQADQKLLVAGRVTAIGGVERRGIGRLNPDGSLDISFAPVLGGAHFSTVYSVALQEDGRILLGGDFASVEGVPRRGIARLHANGILDESFDPGSGIEDAFSSVFDLAIQEDGRVAIGGDFTVVGGVKRNGLARLQTDGGLDTTFDPGGGLGGTLPYVAEIKLLPDGRFLVAGGFESINGTDRAGIARLMPGGGLDGSFVPDGWAGGASAEILDIAPAPGGKVLLVGDLGVLGGDGRRVILRLNEDGSVDTEFAASQSGVEGGQGFGVGVIVDPEGKSVVVGDFERVNGSEHHHVVRLEASGAVDPSFTNSLLELASSVNVIQLQEDGRLLIGGPFERVDGILRRGIARLTPDGGVDPSFDANAGTASVVNAIVCQKDGSVVVGGSFHTLGNQTRTNLARLGPDGAVDLSFDSSQGPDGQVYCLGLQEDNRVIIGGDFQTVQGLPQSQIARLNLDGGLDTSFRPTMGAGPNSPEVYALSVVAGGEVLVAGSFDMVGDQPRAQLARLRPDGSLDTDFADGLDVGGDWPYILTLAVDAAGRVVIGGTFNEVNGTVRGGIARLDSKGNLDPEFDPRGGIEGGAIPAVNCVRSLGDGRVLIAGQFASVSNVARGGIAWLKKDGGLETDFDPGTGVDGSIRTAVVQGDGGVIVGGDFDFFNDQPRSALARYLPRPVVLAPVGVWVETNSVFIAWEEPGALQEAPTVDGPWTLLVNPSKPYVVAPQGPSRFYRLIR